MPSYIKVVAAAKHVLALQDDGVVVGWNNGDEFGQTAIPVGYKAKVIATSPFYSLTIRPDGTVDVWGKKAPKAPPGLKATAVACGGYFALALAEDGTVIQWGPWKIKPPEGLKAKAIAAGIDFAMALQEDGTVVQWVAPTKKRPEPPAGLKAKAIYASTFTSYAMTEDGTVLVWGLPKSAMNLDAIPPGHKFTDIRPLGTRGGYGFQADGTVYQWGPPFAKLPEITEPVLDLAYGGVSDYGVYDESVSAIYIRKSDSQLVAVGPDYTIPAALAPEAAAVPVALPPAPSAKPLKFTKVVSAGGSPLILAVTEDATAVPFMPVGLVELPPIFRNVSEVYAWRNTVTVVNADTHGVELYGQTKMAAPDVPVTHAAFGESTGIYSVKSNAANEDVYIVKPDGSSVRVMTNVSVESLCVGPLTALLKKGTIHHWKEDGSPASAPALHTRADHVTTMKNTVNAILSDGTVVEWPAMSLSMKEVSLAQFKDFSGSLEGGGGIGITLGGKLQGVGGYYKLPDNGAPALSVAVSEGGYIYVAPDGKLNGGGIFELLVNEYYAKAGVTPMPSAPAPTPGLAAPTFTYKPPAPVALPPAPSPTDPMCEAAKASGEFSEAPAPTAPAPTAPAPTAPLSFAFNPPEYMSPFYRKGTKNRMDALYKNAKLPPGFELRPYLNTNGDHIPVWVTTIPKGTVLFRGINTSKQLTEDLFGISKGEDLFCCGPNYTVYFYPFPFMDTIVSNYKYYVIYTLSRDVKVACLINPAPIARADRYINDFPVLPCNKINVGCGLAGRNYDPCFTEAFISSNPDVSGMIGIASEDRKRYRDIRGGLSVYSEYFSEYTDSHELRGAIPELVLRPYKQALETDWTVTVKDIIRKTELAKEDHNYAMFRVMPRNDPAKIKTFMNELLSDGGWTHTNGTVYHAKINSETGFYQIKELSAPFPESSTIQVAGPGFRFARPTSLVG